MDSVDYMMNDIRKQSDVLLTREQEVALSQEIEAGAVAKYIRKNVNPYALQKNTVFDGESLIADIIGRKDDAEGSPLIRVLGLDSNKREDDYELKMYAIRGDRAMERMIVNNVRLVSAQAKNYLGNGMEYTDLMQEGNLGLIHAAQKFDWRLGNKFSTYAVHWIRQYIERSMKNSLRNIRVPVHMEDKIRKVKNAKEAIGDNADVAAIAEKLHYTVAMVESILRYDSITNTLSIDASLDNDGDGGSSTALNAYISSQCDVFDTVSDNDDIAFIRDVFMNDMDDEERMVIMRLHGVGMEKQSAKSIADDMGTNRTMIARIDKRAKNILIDRLKERSMDI